MALQTPGHSWSGRAGQLRWRGLASRQEAGRLSHALAELLTQRKSPADRAAGQVGGVEHEYRVMADGRPVDFRGLIHGLGLGRPNLDPGDANSFRLRSGAAVTADEAEAEIALAPMACGPGFATRIAAVAVAERQALAARLSGSVTLRGYSTHLSVSVPPRTAEATARLFAATFSPALMLLMDQPDSPGMLVRPRPGRIELGGEFADRGRLASALLMALGGLRACAAAIDGNRGGVVLPEALRVALRPDDRRYGWFVDRRAFGPDLYRLGRSSPLTTLGGATLTAQYRLSAAWRVARDLVGGDATAAELAAIDRLVAGVEPLPRPGLAEVGGDAGHTATACPYGAALEARHRPQFDLTPVMLTWDTAVFVVSPPDRRRVAFITIPGPLLDSFQSGLDACLFDEIIDAYLRLGTTHRSLVRHVQTAQPGIFDRMGPRAGLLTPERGPQLSGGWPRGRPAPRFSPYLRGPRALTGPAHA